MLNLDEVKNAYIKAAVLHGESTVSGEYEIGNKQVDIMQEAYKVLRKSEEGRNKLKEIMSHNNPNVRTWAAKDCLPYYPNEAEKILENVSKLDDIFGLNAKITLQEWRKGNLKFD